MTTQGGTADVGGGEEEHRQAQAVLAAARYPALSRVRQANVVHDPGRIFELALDDLILALQALHPDDWYASGISRAEHGDPDVAGEPGASAEPS